MNHDGPIDAIYLYTIVCIVRFLPTPHLLRLRHDLHGYG